MFLSLFKSLSFHAAALPLAWSRNKVAFEDFEQRSVELVGADKMRRSKLSAFFSVGGSAYRTLPRRFKGTTRSRPRGKETEEKGDNVKKYNDIN